MAAFSQAKRMEAGDAGVIAAKTLRISTRGYARAYSRKHPLDGWPDARQWSSPGPEPTRCPLIRRLKGLEVSGDVRTSSRTRQGALSPSLNSESIPKDTSSSSLKGDLRH